MKFDLTPPSPMSSNSLAAATIIAARNLAQRGYITIERNLFGEPTRYVLTEKGRRTFEESTCASDSHKR